MPTASEIVLTDDQRETLMSLGALGWSEDDIAVYFGWDKRLLHSLTVDPDSEISVSEAVCKTGQRSKSG